MASTANKMKKRRRGVARTARAHRATDAASRQALIVLGMHRSGTSALTRVFNLLGADLPRNVMGPGRGNEVGHWESADLVVIHDELLASAGSRWDDWRAFNPEWTASGVAETFRERLLAVMRADFQHSPLFLLKDPRICRFMPVWGEVLARFGAAPHVAIPIRNPVEVAASLNARDGFLPAKSYLLWLRHVLDAERSTRDLPRAFITYDALMDDWRRVARDIGGHLGVRWPRWSDAAALEIDRFMSASLRHHAVDPALLPVRADIVDWVKAAYDALAAIAGQGENARARATLDRVAAEFDRASFAFGLALAEESGRAEEALRQSRGLIEEVETVRRDAAADAAQMRQDVERSAAEAAKASEQAEHAAAELVRAQDQIMQAAADAAELREEASVQAARLHEVSTAHTALLEEAGRLGRELAGAQDSAARLSRELDGARAFLRDSQTEVQRLAGELAHAEARTAAAIEERDAACAEREALAADLRAERMATDQVRAEAARLVGEVVDVREALHETARARDAARDECERLVAAIESERAATRALRHEIEALKVDLQVRTATAEAERACTERLAGELDEARVSLRDSQIEMQRLADEAVRAENAAATLLRTETERLTADLQLEKATVQRAQTEAARLSADLAAAQRDTEARAREATAAGRELTATRALIADLRGTLDQQARLAAERVPLNRAGGGWTRAIHRLFSAQARARAARHAEHAAITRSRLFDALWYLERYPDVAAAGEDPLWHYLMHGATEGRDPHPLFDGKWYIGQTGDLAGSGLSPLGHYVMQGAAAGLDPHPLFDTDWYLAQNPDVAAARINPLYHFWKMGAAAGRDPHPLFDTSWYLEQNPDVARTGDNALYHYLVHGWKEGRDPHPLFDLDALSPQDTNGSAANPLLSYVMAAQRSAHSLTTR